MAAAAAAAAVLTADAAMAAIAVLQNQQDQLMTINADLQAAMQEQRAQLAAATSSAEAVRARTMLPNNLPSKMAARVELATDGLPLLREAHSKLKRAEPDVAGAKEIVGQLYRLNCNLLVGADLSKQQPERAFEVVELYYGESKAYALRPPLDTNWAPERELVKNECARKATLKIVEANIAAAARAAQRTAPKRPFVPFQQQPYRPFPAPPAPQQQQQLQQHGGGGQQRGGHPNGPPRGGPVGAGGQFGR